MSETEILVRIAGVERTLETADAQWVHQTIHAANDPVCMQVRIEMPGIQLHLATPGCSGGGGGRRPNPEEQEVIDLWNHFGLSESGTNPEKLWPFLQRLRNYLGLRAT